MTAVRVRKNRENVRIPMVVVHSDETLVTTYTNKVNARMKQQNKLSIDF